MINCKIILEFGSPVRLPTRRRQGLASAASIGADRFFSFISLGWIQLFGKDSFKSQILEPFLAGHHPWSHSDLFPFTDKGVYLPAELLRDEPERLVSCFRQVWAPLDAVLNDAVVESSTVVTNAILTTTYSKTEKKLQSRTGDGRRFVSLAIGGDLGTHAVARFCGYLQTEKQEFVDRLSTVLAFMKDDGFGGMRLSGLGHIKSVSLETSTAAIFESARSKSTAEAKYLILSPCCPSQQMLADLQNSPAASNRYSISRSGGWIYDENGKHTGLTKAITCHFETGSRFSVKPEGRLVDLSQNGFPCYRYGIPFTVGI